MWKQSQILPGLMFMVWCWVEQFSFASGIQIECVGPQDSKLNGIYLHGLEPLYSKGPQEVEARGVFERAAKKHSLRIAYAVSQSRCERKDGQRRCWIIRGTPEAMRQQVARISEKSSQCFPAGQKKVDFWIGFSNGGYFLNRATLDCVMPPDTRVFSFGSAGTPLGRHVYKKENSRCAPIYLLVGEKDGTWHKTIRLADHLRTTGYRVDFHKFPGWHQITDPAFAWVLQKAFGLNSVP